MFDIICALFFARAPPTSQVCRAKTHDWRCFSSSSGVNISISLFSLVSPLFHLLPLLLLALDLTLLPCVMCLFFLWASSLRWRSRSWSAAIKLSLVSVFSEVVPTLIVTFSMKVSSEHNWSEFCLEIWKSCWKFSRRVVVSLDFITFWTLCVKSILSVQLASIVDDVESELRFWVGS